MTSIQQLTELGERMGLKGEDLRTFIKEQQAEERAQRERDREDKEKQRVEERERAEKERAEKEREREEKERERIYELEKLKFESQREQAQHDKELRQREMEHELKRMQLDRGMSSPSRDDASTNEIHNRVKGKIPKMPYFEEDRDFMDSYLNRFERFAEVQGWRREDMATYLSALLKGRALDVYARLPTEQANDYDVLKQALLKRYQLSAEGFKQRFRSAKPEVGEVPIQFLTRLDSYLQRWIELSNGQKTYDGLKTLIIQEQYISVCPKDMALFLKERAPMTTIELGTLAEQYIEAHNDKPVSVTAREPRQSTDVVKRCFTCGSNSHLAKNCSAQNKRFSTPPNAAQRNTRPASAQDNRKCFICGRGNHLARNCFFKNQTAAMNDTNYREQREHRQNEEQAAAAQVPSAHVSPPPVYECIQHARRNCTECNRPARADGQHSCNALLSHEVVLQCGCKLPVIADACYKQLEHSSHPRMPVVTGLIGSTQASVLRDTGCSTIVVRRSLVQSKQLTGKEELCVLIDGTVRRTPVAEIDIDTPYLTGRVTAVCMKAPLYDLIIGNVTGVRDDLTRHSMIGQAVVTRSQAVQTTTKPLVVPSEIDCNVSRDDFVKAQEEDNALGKAWNEARSAAAGAVAQRFSIYNGILYRNQRLAHGDRTKQLVLPTAFRERVMRLGHEGIMSGHQGIRRTFERVSSNFWWSGMHGDITRFCRSCDVCQRTIAKGRVAKAPLGRVPVIDTPFKRVAVDLVGPLFPCTAKGNRYILTLVDYATRYPEAVPLRNTETVTVAEALVSIFCRVGVPEEVLSDQGVQFTSGIMQEVSRMLSMKQLITTPYHPQCNGLVERFNGTLKMMLKRMCSEKPKDWDRYVDPLLFAYREAPQESLGFSPFEMLYGRNVRGPIKILRELWSKEQTESDIRSSYEYVVDLRNRLQETWDLAHQQLRKVQEKQKRLFDCKAKDRKFKSGDKVLVLLPTNENKLLMQWKGPFEVLEHVSGSDYKVQLPARTRLLHANLLKRYFEREPCNDIPSPTATLTAAAILESQEESEQDEIRLETWSKTQTETIKDVKISAQLTEEQQKQVMDLLVEYQDVFTDVPNITNLGQHSISLTTTEPIRGKAYTLPHAMRETLDKEIDNMLRLDVIEPSTAPYAAPVVLVKKPDGSTRVCIDYRQLNKATVFDPEPVANAEEIFAKLSHDKFFSKFDFSKGYYQVPMKEEDKDLTTFICHRGLFRFKVMPFGLVNAPATFSRIMRRLLQESQGLDNYLDDVLAHDRKWDEHLQSMRGFLDRVRKAKLTLRPSKCEIGESDIAFLGHQLSEGEIRPKQERISKILEAPRPKTKAQVRSFLGLVGFYRKYVPNFAATAAPLTDATRKGAPDIVNWGEAQEVAFGTLKSCLTCPPILRLADFNKPFILQTDASNTGIGAVLLQEDERLVKHPVAYASRKLLPRETRYSTIEKECLAIVWGITKFQQYLYGVEFILETDHQPLQYLGKAQFENGRLMRWALTLQPYRFLLRAIHGKENVGADFLSRHPPDDHGGTIED